MRTWVVVFGFCALVIGGAYALRYATDAWTVRHIASLGSEPTPVEPLTDVAAEAGAKPAPDPLEENEKPMPEESVAAPQKDDQVARPTFADEWQARLAQDPAAAEAVPSIEAFAKQLVASFRRHDARSIAAMYGASSDRTGPLPNEATTLLFDGKGVRSRFRKDWYSVAEIATAPDVRLMHVPPRRSFFTHEPYNHWTIYFVPREFVAQFNSDVDPPYGEAMRNYVACGLDRDDAGKWHVDASLCGVASFVPAPDGEP